MPRSTSFRSFGSFGFCAMDSEMRYALREIDDKVEDLKELMKLRLRRYESFVQSELSARKSEMDKVKETMDRLYNLKNYYEHKKIADKIAYYNRDPKIVKYFRAEIEKWEHEREKFLQLLQSRSGKREIISSREATKIEEEFGIAGGNAVDINAYCRDQLSKWYTPRHEVIDKYSKAKEANNSLHAAKNMWFSSYHGYKNLEGLEEKQKQLKCMEELAMKTKDWENVGVVTVDGGGNDARGGRTARKDEKVDTHDKVKAVENESADGTVGDAGIGDGIVGDTAGEGEATDKKKAGNGGKGKKKKSENRRAIVEMSDKNKGKEKIDTDTYSENQTKEEVQPLNCGPRCRNRQPLRKPPVKAKKKVEDLVAENKHEEASSSLVPMNPTKYVSLEALLIMIAVTFMCYFVLKLMY